MDLHYRYVASTLTMWALCSACSTSSGSALDASLGALDGSGDDSALQLDGGDGSIDSPSSDAPSEADASTGPDAPSDAAIDGSVIVCGGGSCAAGQKSCGGCVSTQDPAFGCGSASCDPCQLAPPGQTVHTQATCSATGQCAILKCEAGWADCNGDPTDGCEANLSYPSTCASCSVQCAAGQLCAPTGCVGACAPPLTQCGSSCVDLTSDPSHCGSCSTICPSLHPDAFAACMNGSCTLSCFAGLTNCSGTCADLSSSPAHCGSCSSACPSVTNGIATCTAGACGAECPPGWALCGSACAPLTADPANCGSCGHACGSGEICERGLCEAPGATTLVSGLSSAEDIAADGVNVYWTDIGDGTVRSAPKAGGNITVLAQGQGRPRRLVVDAQNVYWTDELTAAVMRAPKDGSGSPTMVSAASQPWGIAVDANNVYWGNLGDSTLRQAPISGGSSSVIASVDALEIAMSGPTLWVSLNNFNGYDRVETSGAVTSLVPVNLTGCEIVAANSQYGFLQNCLTYTSTIMRVDPKTNAMSSEIVVAQSPVLPGQPQYPADAIAADACGLYWPGATPGNNWEIMASSIAFPVPIALAPAVNPKRIAVDDEYVYWTDGTQVGRVAKP